MPTNRPDPGVTPDRTSDADATVPPDPTQAGDATAGAFGPAARPFPFLSPPTRPDDLGSLGPYRVVKLLGEGGMGFVFRGEDDALRRPVALKVMRPEVAAGENARDRFLREGRAAAAVKSDHVVTIYQVGEANGVPFLAMEYLAGSTLDDWLKGRGGVAPAAAVVKVAKDTLRGLGAAHDRGLIHRDIKPANLWLEAGTGRVKVLDFGLTRGADDVMTREGALVGTPSYMAPEQAAGRAVDPRADLFSLGVVLYRMAAGRNPFQRGDVWATLTALAVDVPPPAGSVAAALPAGLGVLIDRLVAKTAADRPGSARAALAELAEVERAMKGGTAAGVPVVTVPVVYAPPAAAEPNPWAAVTDSATELDYGPAALPDEPAPVAARRRSFGPLAAVLLGLAVVAAGVIGLLIATRPPAGETVKADPPPGDKTPRPTPAPKPPEELLVPAPGPEVKAGPSPFDALDPAKIPAAERVPWLPKETVAVIGEHRGATSGWDALPTALSPDGKWVAVAVGDGLKVFNTATLDLWLYEPGVAPGAFAFSPDGTRLAHALPPRTEGGDHGVRLLDVTGPTPRRVKDFAFRAENGTTAVAFSADGKTLATGTTAAAIHLWDVAGAPDAGPRASIPVGSDGASTVVQRLLPAAGDRLVAVLSRGGKTVLCGWDAPAAGPKPWFTLPERTNAMRVALAPAGDRLVLPWFDPPRWRADLWDVSGPAPRLASEYDVLAASNALGFTADGGRVIVSNTQASDELVVRGDKLEKARELPKNLVAATPDLSRLIQDAEPRFRTLDNTGKVIADRSEVVCTPRFAPVAAGGRILTFVPDIRGWAVKDGALVATAYPVPLYYRGAFLTQPVVSADGRSLAGIGPDQAIRVLAVEPDGVRPLSHVTLDQNSGAGLFQQFLWHPDGKRLATLCRDSSAGVWDVATDPSVRTATWAKAGSQLVLAPAGDASAEYQGLAGEPVALRRLADTKVTRTMPGVPDGVPVLAAFSPDGRSLYAGYFEENSTNRLRRYDLTRRQPAGEVVWEKPGVTNLVRLDFSPDGKRLLACLRGRLFVLDAATRAELVSVELTESFPQRDYCQARWADDGRHVLLGQHGCVYVLRVPDRR